MKSQYFNCEPYEQLEALGGMVTSAEPVRLKAPKNILRCALAMREIATTLTLIILTSSSPLTTA